jgi:hypothetical protein
MDSAAPAERMSARDAVDSPRSVLQVLDADPATFRQCFGRLPFALRHNLASSGLFAIDRLTTAAERMIATGRGGRLMIFEGTRRSQNPGAKFEDMKHKKPFAAALSELESSNSWIDFVNIDEVDPELDDLCRKTLQDVATLLGTPTVKDAIHCHMNVFISSPHVITPYHFDHGQNILCQISSEKDVWLWDPSDRETLSELAIERFYFDGFDRSRRQLNFDRGREFHIRPGDAVHHPSLAPHWVKNGPNVSISVGIAFSTAALYRDVRIYQANSILRRIGLKPPPPGRSAVLDGLRSGAISILNKSSPKNTNEALFTGINRLKRWNERLKRPFRAARRILTRSSTRLS